MLQLKTRIGSNFRLDIEEPQCDAFVCRESTFITVSRNVVLSEMY